MAQQVGWGPTPLASLLGPESFPQPVPLLGIESQASLPSQLGSWRRSSHASLPNQLGSTLCQALSATHGGCWSEQLGL